MAVSFSTAAAGATHTLTHYHDLEGVSMLYLLESVGNLCSVQDAVHGHGQGDVD